ncbi:MAG TPA: helix-turn-helix transcriptional regulator [Thermoanaerobaculia bacterium]|jgi:transcriptional regulator with XRE-family HTH domain
MSPRRKKNIHPEIARVLDRLRIAVQAMGYSLRDIEKRLGVSDGYLSRVFLGTIELKIEHIIAIARALQMAPEELFAFVYPKPKEPISPSAYELWRRAGGVPAGGLPGIQKPGQSPLTTEAVEQAVRRALGDVFGSLATKVAKPEG